MPSSLTQRFASFVHLSESVERIMLSSISGFRRTFGLIPAIREVLALALKKGTAGEGLSLGERRGGGRSTSSLGEMRASNLYNIVIIKTSKSYAVIKSLTGNIFQLGVMQYSPQKVRHIYTGSRIRGFTSTAYTLPIPNNFGEETIHANDEYIAER